MKILPKEYKAHILIITALEEEFDSIKNEFKGEFYTSKTSNQQYYIVNLHNSTLNRELNLVISTIGSMGNSEASNITSFILKEIKPKSIILFGLAGAIGEDIDIGDVIVADKIRYYESSKELNGETEDRNKTHRSDPHLYKLIKNFYRERKDEFNVNGNFVVKFGTIASGEKVIASDEFKKRILRIDSKILAVDMESYGVYLSAFTDLSRPRCLTIRVICDKADQSKNDVSRSPVLQKAAGLIKKFLIEGIPIIDNHEELNESYLNFIAIHHISQEFRPFSQNDVKKIHKEFSDSSIEIFQIDLSDNYVDGKLINLISALRKQNTSIDKLFEEIRKYNNLKIGYFSLAHIPFVFHLGHKLQTIPVTFYIAPRPTRNWDKLSASSSDFQKLNSNIDDLDFDVDCIDLIFKMSISVTVQNSQIDEIIESSSLPLLTISAENTILDNLTNEAQLKEYAETFSRTIQRIKGIFPNLNKVHLFYAGPPTLAFLCGQQISKTMDPDVIAYNFSKMDKPSYGWGINIKTDEIVDFRGVKEKEQ